MPCSVRQRSRSIFSSDRKNTSKYRQKPCFYRGGETIVHVTGKGLGGRNQELALAAAEGLAACRNTAIFSVGSDGTDGPTDAAGGYCDENTKENCSWKEWTFMKC